MVRFSLIIPFCNEEKYLARCLDSVFQQTYDKNNYEVILIDDGSTDNSVAIAAQYPVQLLATKVKGFNTGGARNLGFDHAQGEYIILLDADDYLASDTVLADLDRQINGAEVVFVKVKKVDGKQVTILEENARLSLDEQIYQSSNFCLTLKCFQRALISDIRYQPNCYHEDIAFVMELMCKAQKAAYFDDIFFVYWRDGTAVTVQYSLRKALDFTKQVLEYLYLIEKYPQRFAALKARIQNEHYDQKITKLCTWALDKTACNYQQF